MVNPTEAQLVERLNALGIQYHGYWQCRHPAHGNPIYKRPLFQFRNCKAVAFNEVHAREGFWYFVGVNEMQVDGVYYYSEPPKSMFTQFLKTKSKNERIYVKFHNSLVPPPLITVRKKFKGGQNKGYVRIAFKTEDIEIAKMAYNYCQGDVPHGVFLDFLMERVPELGY